MLSKNCFYMFIFLSLASCLKAPVNKAVKTKTQANTITKSTTAQPATMSGVDPRTQATTPIPEPTSTPAPTQNQKIWVTPPQALSEHAKFVDVNNIYQWQTAFDMTSTFKFYLVNIDSAHPTYLGESVVAKLKTFSAYAKSKNKKIAFEVGGLYAAACDTGPYGADGMPLLAKRGSDYEGYILKQMIDAKISIDYLVLDGPFIRVFDPGMGSNCVQKFGARMSVDYVAAQLATYMKSMRALFPQVKFILLTNFPNWNFQGIPSINGVGDRIKNSSGQIINYETILPVAVNTALQQGVRFDGFQIDNPYNFFIYKNGSSASGVVSNVELNTRWSRIQGLINLASFFDLPVGLILNAEVNEASANPSSDFAELTMRYAEDFQTRKLIAANFVVQSWYAVPKAIIPESENFSFMNLVTHIGPIVNLPPGVPLFNEACYLRRYPDVLGWVNGGGTALSHWNQHGVYEKRIPGCDGL